MQYVATISSAGQITLPKALRTFLGVERGNKIIIDADEKTQKVTLGRKMTNAEILAGFERLNSELPDATKQRIKERAHKTVRELREDFDKSLEGKAAGYRYTEAYYCEQHPEEPRSPEIQAKIDEHNALLDYLLKSDPTFKNRVEEYRAL